MPRRRQAPAPDDDRVSLAPLEFEEALAALLRVDPDGAPAEDDDDEREEGPPA